MNIRNNSYTIELREEMLMPFEEQVLASGLCDFILPVNISIIPGKKQLTYECSGYTVLEDMKLEGIKEIFEIIEKTLLTLKKSYEFLIDPEKVTLNMDTVYFHRKHRDVKIIFIPGPRETMSVKVSKYISMLSKLNINEGKDYLIMLENSLFFENLNLTDAVNKVGLLKREMYQCGIQ